MHFGGLNVRFVRLLLNKRVICHERHELGDASHARKSDDLPIDDFHRNKMLFQWAQEL